MSLLVDDYRTMAQANRLMNARMHEAIVVVEPLAQALGLSPAWLGFGQEPRDRIGAPFTRPPTQSSAPVG